MILMTLALVITISGLTLSLIGQANDTGGDLVSWGRIIADLGATGVLILALWGLLTGRIYTPMYVRLLSGLLDAATAELKRLRERDEGRAERLDAAITTLTDQLERALFILRSAGLVPPKRGE